MKEANLEGRSALVTGGGRGIGRATALALARCGATVYVVARSEGEIEEVAGTIRREGGQAEAIPCDISRVEDVQELFRSAEPIDILINNAARIQPIAPVVNIDPGEWRRNMATNLDGVFFMCHFALPHMLERRWGRIVNLSAGAARGSQSHWGAYASAKAGVETLTKILAQEVGDRGIRANVVRPGIVDTDMQSEVRSSTEEQFGRENLDRFRGYYSRGLLRPPEHPARLILWLLSPEADEINGEVLYIDDPEVAARIGLEARGR